jgi:uncharacterized membrane protein YsdA (DUF1294 family)/cold shock CspA family protein
MHLQQQGEITSWNDEKGFGFITPASGYDRIFVHIKAFKQRHGRPQINQYVSFSCSKDKQGRPCAIDVAYIGKQPTSPQHSKAQRIAYTFVALFFVALGIVIFAARIIPIFIIALYAIASTITFVTYALDKSAAKKGHWRTSEATLHLMSLLGGWPGALLAQQTLRHKSSKAEFKVVYRITVVLNVAVIAWLLTPQGPELTMTFLEKVFVK